MTSVAERNVIRTFASISSALMALTLRFKWLGGPLARTAPPESETGDDPYVEASAASATITVADHRPGKGVARTVFSDFPGILATAFEFSGSALLALASCLPFCKPGQRITFCCRMLSAPVARHAAPAGSQRA
jgi:hypothetical protein